MNAATTFHMCLHVEGALRNMKPREMEGVFRDSTGRILSPAEARATLKLHAYKGHKVIPCCDAVDCPDFDYHGSGCPGHPQVTL